MRINDLGEYNMSYSVRFNYINGLPKLTIFNKTHKAKIIKKPTIYF